MPKGKMSVHGSGPFHRVRLPKEGKVAVNDEQKKLLSLVQIKSEVMGELSKRGGPTLEDEKAEQAWEEIVYAVGGYLGQSKRGLPPTGTERDRVLKKIERAALKLEKAASKLEDEIIDAPFHVNDLLHKSMRRQGGDLFELKKHLNAISSLIPASQMERQPKERPDPYVEALIRDLIDIWTSCVGKPPSKTGTDHYKGVRTSPFFLWSNRIAEVGIGKALPRDLMDTVIGLSRPQG